MSSNPPLSLPNTRTHFRLAPLATAAVLALSALVAPATSSAAAKAPAPSLTIQAKTCLVGAAAADRSVSVTALALLGTAGDRVTMRFTVQSRQGKTRWRSLLFKDPASTKKWETTDAAGAGLKLTKVIPELEEGYDYRVMVESRSIDAAGKVITKTARRYVPCVQPIFTPTVELASVAWKPIVDENGAKTGGYGLAVGVKNIGRLPADAVTISVSNADTLELYTEIGGGPIKGRSTSTSLFTGPTCTGQMLITVQITGADPTTLTPAQRKTISCTPSAEKAAKAAARARR